MPDYKRMRRRIRFAAAFFTLVALGVGVDLLLRHPQTPLPPEWNPAAALRISDPVSPLTHWKLRRATRDRAQCLAALVETDAVASEMPDYVESDVCGIKRRVRLSQVGEARFRPFETRCDIALRLAYWERHGLQPAAQEIFGEGIAAIEHFSSYSCRQIRTTSGLSNRMSLHATAEAVDIVGVRLESGRLVRLINGWNGAQDEAAFFRAARDTACQWFPTVLSPDYNQLHADHFHLQSRGWGLCR